MCEKVDRQNRKCTFGQEKWLVISRVLLRCQSDSSAALTFFNWVKNDLGLKHKNTRPIIVVLLLTLWHGLGTIHRQQNY